MYTRVSESIYIYTGFPPEIYDSAQVGVVDGCVWLIDFNIY